MISPRLSMVMIAMSVFGTVAPMTAMAQDFDFDLGSVDQLTNSENFAVANTGGNEQTNNALVAQSAKSNVEIGAEGEDCGECGNVEIERASVGNAENEAEVDQSNELETGDADANAEQDVEVDAETELEDIEFDFEDFEF
jgi:hypothetical protein